MPEPGRRRRLGRWGLVLLWAAVLLGLSSIPNVGERLPGPLLFPGSDLVAHAVVYGVFGALLAHALGRWWPAFLIASAFGALDEFYQGFVPGRFPSTLDWLVDSVAGGVGAAVALAARRRLGIP